MLALAGVLLFVAAWPLCLVAIMLAATFETQADPYFVGGVVWTISVALATQILISARNANLRARQRGQRAHGTISSPAASARDGNPGGARAACQTPAADCVAGATSRTVSPYPTQPVDCVMTARDSDLRRLTQVAMSTYPQARERFLRALEPGQALFVKIRLCDRMLQTEDVFVKVDSIEDGLVRGRINSPVVVVLSNWRGQAVCVEEGALLDWVITNPDGSEDGNLIGKYFDANDPSSLRRSN